MTLDYYHIEIDDRLALLTSNHDRAGGGCRTLITAGIPPSRSRTCCLGSNANFFVNGFDSEVDGIDLAIASLFKVGGGDLLVDLRHNFNRQEVPRVSPGTINASRVFDLENQTPENRTLLSFDYRTSGMSSAPAAFQLLS